MINICVPHQGKEVEVAIATKVQKEEKQKGDLMENNAEAMEYSSEDFSDDNIEDLNYAGYKNKKRRVSGAVFVTLFERQWCSARTPKMIKVEGFST